ncbi:unnamed protein product [Sphagnum tenellum]
MSNNNKFTVENGRVVDSQPSPTSTSKSNSSCQYGQVLGFEWPPSSYFCSFCHREFRTAQALGGHMNVHRRERAAAHRSNAAHQLRDPSFFSSTSLTSSLHQAVVTPDSYRSSTSCLRQELSGSPTALKGPAAARLQRNADSTHEAEAATASCRSTVAQSEHHHQDHQISSLDLELRLGHMQSSP